MLFFDLVEEYLGGYRKGEGEDDLAAKLLGTVAKHRDWKAAGGCLLNGGTRGGAGVAGEGQGSELAEMEGVGGCGEDEG